MTFYAGMKGMSENVFPNVKNRALTITADVEIPAGGADGVILAQGGRFGGWTLYMKGGKPVYCYNFIGLQRFTVAGTQVVPPGKATIRVEFAYDGGGAAKGGLATIYVNGKKAGEGRSNARSLGSSRPTRPPTSARTMQRPSPRTTRRTTTSSPARSSRSRST